MGSQPGGWCALWNLIPDWWIDATFGLCPRTQLFLGSPAEAGGGKTKALLHLETTVGACRNCSRVLGESIRGSRDRGVLVLSFCVHPYPSLLPGEVLAAVHNWLCEGCSHSQDKLLWAWWERTSQAVCVTGVWGLFGGSQFESNLWKHHSQTPQQEGRFCSRTQRKSVQIIGNFKKSHHISTLSQVRGLQRVRKEAHNFHLGLFRPLKQTNKQ